MEIVLVYLGSEVPKYVRDNLVLLGKQFPDFTTVLLTDNPSIARQLSTELSGIKIELVSNPEDSWRDTLGFSGYSREFRDNFWGKTLARFYSIYEYMSRDPENSILHVEADVWLSPNFPLKKVSSIIQLIAYPLTNKDQGVASTVFFKNLKAAELLKNFSEESMVLDNQTTDVSVLGHLYRQYPGDVLILPTAPTPEYYYHPHVDSETKTIMSNHFSEFGGVFDASTWGQFITGEDPRNSVGKKLVYHHQLHHAVCPVEQRFSFENCKALLSTNKSIRFEIFSLHVHSKSKAIFNYTSSCETISYYAGGYRGKQNSEFLFLTFMRTIFPFLRYRMRLYLKKVLRFN